MNEKMTLKILQEKDYIEVTKTSLITLKKDLSNLTKKEIIKRVGSTKTRYYILGTKNDTIKTEENEK